MWDCNSRITPSDMLSGLSCGFWVFAQLPQILQNYRTKSTNGLSPGFLGLWLLGDCLNLGSCLLNKSSLRFQVLLSLFFVCNDLVLCVQYRYYSHNYVPVAHSLHPHDDGDYLNSRVKSRTSSYDGCRVPAGGVALASIPVARAVATVTVVSPGRNLSATDYAGQILAWACTAVYISSRFPQLLKNYRRKSVDGISPLLFASAFLGNLMYTLSILSSCNYLSRSRSQFLIAEAPYLIGSSGTLVFDACYFYQRSLYKRCAVRNASMDVIEMR